MGLDEADKIDYQYEPKDNSFKMKGAYLVPRTKVNFVPCVCHCVNNHFGHSKLVIGNGIWNRLI